jgi:hypothetical protein
MTAGSWATWLAMTVVYLGAFLSGIRPAAWFGTRLAPLVAAAGLAMIFSYCWLPVAVIAVIVADLWFVSTILTVANSRNFT